MYYRYKCIFKIFCGSSCAQCASYGFIRVEPPTLPSSPPPSVCPAAAAQPSPGFLSAPVLSVSLRCACAVLL